jgi:hypothetical protein
MLHECPNCRESVSYFRLFRTPAWGSFRCKACGSILTISFARRILGAAIWVVLLLVTMEYGGFYGLPRVILYPLMVVSIVAVLYVCEKVVLLERRAFTCRKCGYDLHGLTETRCPECGETFDPAERERILERSNLPPPKPRRRWIAVLVVIALALLVSAGLGRYRRAARPVVAPTTAPTTAPSASAPAEATGTD